MRDAVPTRKQGCALGALDGLGDVAQPGLSSGLHAFGKTRAAGRKRITRTLRLRGGLASRDSAAHERPRADWIEIPVPVLMSEESFARAQELLQENKIRSRRRTITPSIVQGMVSCQKCGYAFSRTSTYTQRTQNPLLPMHWLRQLATTCRSGMR